MQATRSNCGPFIEVAPLDNGTLTRAGATACAGFGQSVLDYARRTPTITTVVLASTFEKYANRDADVLRHQQGTWRKAAGGPQQASADLAQTVQQRIAMGKRVVVVAPPARADVDVGMCLEREARGKLNVRATGCTILAASKSARQGDVAAALQSRAAMQLDAAVQVVDLAEPLCDATRCQTIVEATPLYRDDRHFSVLGSGLLAQRQHWDRWLKFPSTEITPTPQSQRKNVSRFCVDLGVACMSQLRRAMLGRCSFLVANYLDLPLLHWLARRVVRCGRRGNLPRFAIVKTTPAPGPLI